MSTHCNKYPGCGCPPHCGEKCHIKTLGTSETVGDLLDKLNEIPFNADFGFRNQPVQTLYYDKIKVSAYFQPTEPDYPIEVKTAEQILEETTCCTIDEDADIDDVKNFYYQHQDVLKAMETHAKILMNQFLIHWQYANR